MGIYDRDYYRPDGDQQARTPQMHFRFPQLTPMVKRLLIINISVFLLCIIIKPLGLFIYEWFSVDSTSASTSLQPWRLITYQFLHDPASAWHIILNMLGLYFLGPTLERFWHSKKFLIFYLCCGIAGGVLYLLLAGAGIVRQGSLIGASGAILGMLAACAILFPQFVVILFIFPVPIRWAAIILTFLYVVNIFIGSANAGGDVAHLTGMVVGAGYVYLWPKWKNKSRVSLHVDDWDKKIKAYSQLQKEVDRILAKVNEQGIGSLTKKEKKTLEEATKLEQMKSRL
ncbi:MAG: rhomboid family intramembrane serine protease [Planctomycetes bacterium]|nr:rhomboid family intramembrane serine protease [Planctomycetota bacterium]MBU1518649.1 rhomboid family intramembrane serine protease [Planctomycetota bacterium]MBU2458131.1 rhomboid family intramembrane serine protease [Planctomycetota bacterium]MBU2597184.1 rhomboid family intramembrane serine protease [Planctomycetota bacterium]